MRTRVLVSLLLALAVPAAAAGADPARRFDIPLEGSPALGPPGAPVTVVEFLDFQ